MCSPSGQNMQQQILRITVSSKEVGEAPGFRAYLSLPWPGAHLDCKFVSYPHISITPFTKEKKFITFHIPTIPTIPYSSPLPKKKKKRPSWMPLSQRKTNGTTTYIPHSSSLNLKKKHGNFGCMLPEWNVYFQLTFYFWRAYLNVKPWVLSKFKLSNLKSSIKKSWLDSKTQCNQKIDIAKNWKLLATHGLSMW